MQALKYSLLPFLFFLLAHTHPQLFPVVADDTPRISPVIKDSLPGVAQKDTGLRRENINGADVVPEIIFPGITQDDFREAFNVLDECLIVHEPTFGFNHPFIAPGGHYGGCWWQVDASIALHATRWVNQRFSENVLRGFISVQKPDGRIPLYGYDSVPGFPVCSSLPKLFQSAYNVLKQTNDRKLIRDVYACLKKYLDWWLSPVRKDSGTGLITGVFEESFPPFQKQLKAEAQVDLNVEVVAGCHYVSLLAQQLGIAADREKYSTAEKKLKAAINTYMWNKTAGAYYSYHPNDQLLDDKLVCYTFDPFRLNIAPPERLGRMIAMLTDDTYFNWQHNGVTSASKTDKIYNESAGDYNGSPAWSGDIWTLRNEAIIEGLEAIGRYDLASLLSLKTVRLFNHRYAEFIKPSDGSGQGVKNYAWSAAQYIQIIIEKIFGIGYDGFQKNITIQPNLNEALNGKTISIERLLLPNGNRLSLHISKSSRSVRIKYNITGESRDMNIIVALPFNGNQMVSLQKKPGSNRGIIKTRQQAATIYQVSNGKNYTDELDFIITEQKESSVLNINGHH